MGFQYAANLGGAGAPVKRNFLTSETCYVGQLVKRGVTAGTGGHIQIADVAAELEDVNDLGVLGLITGIVDDSRTYVAAVSGTAGYGDRTTYTVTQSDVKADGPSEVEVVLIQPMTTLIRAPLFDTVWGTALTEQVNTVASSGGVLITAVATAPADVADDYGTVYCRSGANRGIYRIVTANDGSGAITVTVPFPNAIAVGDVFVNASMVLGHCHWQIPATADCLDGDNTLGDCFPGFCWDLNLEESGKEYAVLTTVSYAHVHTT